MAAHPYWKYLLLTFRNIIHQSQSFRHLRYPYPLTDTAARIHLSDNEAV